jgi:hypothetical protein
MLKIKTSDISLGSAMPYQASMIDWLNAADAADNTALVAGLSNNNAPTKYCLQGAVLSGAGPYNITQGYVIISGQIYSTSAITGLNVGAGQVIVGNITSAYPLVGTFDPVTFSDGVTHNVHEFNYIVWSAGASGSGDIDFSELTYLRSQWQTPTYASGWAGYTYVNDTPAQFKKDAISNKVIMRGCTRALIANVNTTILTLPSGYIPNTEKFIPIFMVDQNGGGNVGGYIRILTNGTIIPNFWATPSGTHIVVCFDNVSFPLD